MPKIIVAPLEKQEVQIRNEKEVVATGTVGKRADLVVMGGNLTCDDIDEEARVIVYDGKLTCKNIGKKAFVKTDSYDLCADDVGEKAHLETSNANIRVKSVHPSATFNVTNGSIYINNVKQVTHDFKKPSSSNPVNFFFIPEIQQDKDFKFDNVEVRFVKK